MSEQPSASEATPAPTLRIVSGNPTDEDVAVLVAVLGAAGGGDGEQEQSTDNQNMWGRPVDMLRSTDPLAPSVFLNVAQRY
ncbi:acyl-CoA carboxylase subunit epsilon [Williamsia sp. CHRR-6]|uniref:acyl-CoA carboxylase subunit epsilon n=1 Tax=Williamsia sp. CHRR-6 TaxID=2835871 RepID=UPI001BD92810|nr:acyl-CoA carboxylase subunit epsilon [Williamsia sp. CHRR-6]MBT0566876.1 acyl-CoA carboxylase subunit epsilon [Williamsia sp. CHRR-6]